MSSGAVFSGPALPQRLLKNRNLVFRHTLLKTQVHSIFLNARQCVDRDRRSRSQMKIQLAKQVAPPATRVRGAISCRPSLIVVGF